LTFSSDLVFDGQQEQPYLETDKTSPLGLYGCTKAKAEHFVMSTDPDALMVRAGHFFDPAHRTGYLARVLQRLVAGQLSSAPNRNY
jgi:dTDP-4-dehydrorhamnose reductase